MLRCFFLLLWFRALHVLTYDVVASLPLPVSLSLSVSPSPSPSLTLSSPSVPLSLALSLPFSLPAPPSVSNKCSVVLDAFDLCHYDVRVVVLRRFFPDLVNSHMRVEKQEGRYFESNLQRGKPIDNSAKWYYVPHDRKIAVLPSCYADGHDPSDIENLLGYLYDVEAHVKYIRERYPRVPFYPVRLAQIQERKEVNKLFARLGLEVGSSASVRASLARLVGTRVNTKGSTVGDHSAANVAHWGPAISKFEADCAAAGVTLPTLVSKTAYVSSEEGGD